MLAPDEPTDQKLIDEYLRLKDRIKEFEDEYKEKVAPYTRGMQAITGEVYRRLVERNAKHTSVDGGTAFRVRSMTVKCSNKEEYIRFCMSNPDEGANLLTAQVSKDALAGFMERHNEETPPGVDVNWVETVQIRRA